MAEAPYVDPGPSEGPVDCVVLDIGGDIGALIVYTTESCVGMEIDLTPAGQPRSHHVHTAVRRINMVSGQCFAGVYGDLAEGRYTVWGRSGALGEVEVRGGAVSTYDAGDCSGP